MLNAFDDIRPYNDAEARAVLQRLLGSDEFIRALTVFHFPRLSRMAGFILQGIVRRKLNRMLAPVTRVRQFQEMLEPYIIKMIRRTTENVTWSGGEMLDPDTSYLFLSNHRDIVLDPTLVNYGLHLCGRDTVRIAIGDNLLKKPFVSDLMRLNKSFIVKRSAGSRKEKLAAFKTLSQYITHSLETGNSVWLAQREGRAKDGNDFTDAAIIKMLGFAHRGREFSQMLSTLNIVPVAISYEVDPCDFMKARELYLRSTGKTYVKAREEDLTSIISGIQGWKGRVHVAFGQPVPQETEDVDSCIRLIDRQIHTNYRQFALNYVAYQRLYEHSQPGYPVPELWKQHLSVPRFNKGKALLEERLALCEDEGTRLWLLKLYANPVRNKLAAEEAELPATGPGGAVTGTTQAGGT